MIFLNILYVTFYEKTTWINYIQFFSPLEVMDIIVLDGRIIIIIIIITNMIESLMKNSEPSVYIYYFSILATSLKLF